MDRHYCRKLYAALIIDQSLFLVCTQHSVKRSSIIS